MPFPDSLKCLQCTGHSLAGSAKLERRGRENPGPVAQASLHCCPAAKAFYASSYVTQVVLIIRNLVLEHQLDAIHVVQAMDDYSLT